MKVDAGCPIPAWKVGGIQTRMYIAAAALLAAGTITALTLASAGVSFEGTLPDKPNCKGQKSLAAKVYDSDRWWKYADPTPAAKREDRRLDAFVKDGCPKSIRQQQKAQYGRYYRKVIAPCKHGGERFANCAVARCESSYGHDPEGHAYTYGLTVYWHDIAPLPPWGNHSRTGHRFAPEEPASTHIENNVFAAAAFSGRYAPLPATCAS